MVAQGTTSESDKSIYSHKPSLTSSLKRIMCDTLDRHKGSVGIGGRLITNFRFADDIVINTDEGEADHLVDCLDTTTTRYKMEICPGRSEA